LILSDLAGVRHATHPAAPPAAIASTTAALWVAVRNASSAASWTRTPLAPKASAICSAPPG